MTTAEQQYTSLLNPLAFPPFTSCPHEYFHQPESVPTHHWCFLGEIKDISGIGRLCLDVEDREGITVRIYFYLDHLPPDVVRVVINPPNITYPQHTNLPRHLVQKGNTIAVLYAQLHPWRQESSVGIRIEDGDMVQIFPCGLEKLLSLSGQILEDIQPSEPRVCGECGENAATLRVCTACRLAWYCNAQCQRADWSGHKKECKLTGQVKLLMKQDWGQFETYFKFPLSV